MLSNEQIDSLSKIRAKLEKNWIFDFHDLRVSDEDSNVYAITFYPFKNEGIQEFLTRLQQNFLRIRVSFVLESSIIYYQPDTLCIVDIRLKG